MDGFAASAATGPCRGVLSVSGSITAAKNMNVAVPSSTTDPYQDCGGFFGGHRWLADCQTVRPRTVNSQVSESAFLALKNHRLDTHRGVAFRCVIVLERAHELSDAQCPMSSAQCLKVTSPQTNELTF